MPQHGRKKVVVYETDSGVIIHVTMIATSTIKLMDKRAQEVYPTPDPKPFEAPLPNAENEGVVIPATDNPEYVKLLNAVDVDRNNWMARWVFDTALEYPDGITALVERFKGKLEHMRDTLDSSLDPTDWNTVFEHCIADKTEQLVLFRIAMNQAELEEVEVAEAFRFFRCKIQWETSFRLALQRGLTSGLSAIHRKNRTQSLPR